MSSDAEQSCIYKSFVFFLWFLLSFNIGRREASALTRYIVAQTALPRYRCGCPCRGLCKSKIIERKKEKKKKKNLRTKIDNPLKRTTQNSPARALPVCRLLLRPVLTRPLIDAVGKSPSRAAPPQGMKHARTPCVQEFIVEEERCRVISGQKRAWTVPTNACTTRWETGRRQQHEQNDEYLRRS